MSEGFRSVEAAEVGSTERGPGSSTCIYALALNSPWFAAWTVGNQQDRSSLSLRSVHPLDEDPSQHVDQLRPARPGSSGLNAVETIMPALRVPEDGLDRRTFQEGCCIAGCNRCAQQIQNLSIDIERLLDDSG